MRRGSPSVRIVVPREPFRVIRSITLETLTKISRLIQYSRKVLEQDKKSCFCQFIVSFIEILFTYSR